MKYEIKKTSKFKKDFDLVLKRGLNLEEFKTVIELLAEGAVLPGKYKDHPLRNTDEFKDCRELHIEPDWLLVYKYSNENLILYLIRTGSHSDLF